MGGLILCGLKEATNPYYIKESGINIYSLEELCFYIYNNIYILNGDFINDELIGFIRYEIKETELADMLTDMLGSNAELTDMLITVLKYVDYYSDDEIEQLIDEVKVLNTKNVYERYKQRGDSFLNNKKYYRALENYLKIIEGQRDFTLPGIFYVKIYHNAGVALAKMFLYGQAAVFFETAYKIGRNSESLKCCEIAKKMAERDCLVQDTSKLPPELKTVIEHARYSDDYRKVQSIERKKENGQVAEYYQEISDMMDEWIRRYMWNVT